MSRPPVGSTGTLDDLQVEPGDVVECITVGDGRPGAGEALRIDNRGYAVNANIDAFTPRGDVISGRTYRLISRANPDQPAHIVTHEGREYDLTALETPFGLLPEPVKEALHAWPHGVEMMTYSGNMVGYNSPDMKGKRGAVWRAKPAPAETRVQCYRGEYGKPKEHGTCIKSDDGSINWQSWEDEDT